MCWTVEYADAEGIVHVEIKGVVTLDLVRRILPEFISVLEQNDCRKAFVHYTEAISRVSSVDIFEVPGLLRRCGYDMKMRVAVHFGEGSFLPPQLQFWGTVSHNQGVFGINFFEDEGEALRWLDDG